jgi:hypothetical protein
VVTKAKRLKEFIKRLREEPPATAVETALALLSRTLNTVEDEMSEVPFRPERWQTDGRMYPPKEDSRVKCPEHPSLKKYRNKGHYDYFGSNGSIRIETLGGEVLLDKPGQDGRKAYELDA